MFARGLLICVLLRAFSTQAKVVTEFNPECSKFFYKGTEPTWMNQNAKKICQKVENGGFYYATLYSDDHKIPLYSAYTLNKNCTTSDKVASIWHLEPQISQPGHQIDHMVRESYSTINAFQEKQAISKDYSDTGYDRGHLYPNSFQCNEGRKATFTLTNAAPMDACFNRIQWKKWESTLRSFLLKNLKSDIFLADAYIVTGTVPTTIPISQKQEVTEAPKKRVMVPSHIWTAVCYKHRLDDEKSFSFSYLGENLPEGDITLMSVENLNSQLSVLNSYQTIQIFADNCFGNNNKLSKVQGEFQKLISLKVCKNQMNTKIQNICNNLGVIIPAINRKRTTSQLFDVSEMTVKLAFNSMSSYFTGVEELKTLHGSACLITRAKPLKKGDVSTDEVECMLVPEKQNTAADGSSCLYRSESDNVCRCYYEGGHKPCCSSSCLYQDELQDYRCYSGQELVRCSPRYSLITADGQRCKEDHPCATYGHGYYWCRTSAEETSPCSPPLWRSKAKNGKYCRSNHACAKYGQSEPWCYTDDEGNSDKCSTSDDCYSAVNGKTCRSDHECGYHGYSFLWCYTDDNNNWEYCCTDCDDGGNTDNTCVNTYASPFSNYAPAWM